MADHNEHQDEAARQAHELDQLEASLSSPASLALEHTIALTDEVMDLTAPNSRAIDTIQAEGRKPKDPNAGPLKFTVLMRDAGVDLNLAGQSPNTVKALILSSDAEAKISQKTGALDNLRIKIGELIKDEQRQRTSVTTTRGETFDIRLEHDGSNNASIAERRVTMHRGAKEAKWDEVHGPEPKDIYLHPGGFFAYIPNENLATPLNSPGNPRNWDDHGMARFLEGEIIPGLMQGKK